MSTQDTITGAKAKTYSVTGPASYATGGFLHDASADFSWIGYIDIAVATRGVLPPCDYEMDLNVDTSAAEALGKAVIKVVRGRYDRATLGAATGKPSGVTIESALTATATTSGSGHTHSINHTHTSPVTSLSNNAPGSLGVLLASGGGNSHHHTHDFTIPAFSGTSSSTTHSHNRSFEYDHSHGNTQATTNVSLVEMANTTDLSGVTFKLTVYGFGKQ